jgi:mRNA interferase MazF
MTLKKNTNDEGRYYSYHIPFTDLSGSKLRSALVLAGTASDVTVLFITTQLKWMDTTDVVINPDTNNGIKKRSLIRVTKIATLDKTLVQGKLGFIDRSMYTAVENKLKAYLQIAN